jgi:hypothetical protein
MKFGEIFLSIWNFKFSLVPVLVTYLIFDLPALMRKLTRVAYVPIYFIFFPLGHSDRLYAQYFNEDWMLCEGASMTDEQKRRLRHEIQATAIISMIFATIVTPWLCGFIAALYLPVNQFTEFLFFVLIVKAILVAWSLWQLRGESPAVQKSLPYVAALYCVYLFLVWRGLTKAYDWTHQHLTTDGVMGLAVGLLDYAYVDIFINVLIVSGITWALTTIFTKPSNIFTKPSNITNIPPYE